MLVDFETPAPESHSYPGPTSAEPRWADRAIGCAVGSDLNCCDVTRAVIPLDVEATDGGMQAANSVLDAMICSA
jgi:hypothetical protein